MSASSKPKRSGAPVSSTDSACAGLAAERASVIRNGSPNRASSRPRASTTATWATCVFSIASPRYVTTAARCVHLVLSPCSGPACRRPTGTAVYRVVAAHGRVMESGVARHAKARRPHESLTKLVQNHSIVYRISTNPYNCDRKRESYAFTLTFSDVPCGPPGIEKTHLLTEPSAASRYARPVQDEASRPRVGADLLRVPDPAARFRRNRPCSRTRRRPAGSVRRRAGDAADDQCSVDRAVGHAGEAFAVVRSPRRCSTRRARSR